MASLHAPLRWGRLNIFLTCVILLLLLALMNYRESLNNLYLEKSSSIDYASNDVSSLQGPSTLAQDHPRPSSLGQDHPIPPNLVQDNPIPSALTKEEVASGELRLPQDDELLLNFIRLYHLKPPGQGQAKLTGRIGGDTRGEEQQEVARFIIKTLQKQTGGFFIECGASDGEYFSNTIELELRYNWTGLLIEADPRPLNKLLTKNRHAWVANACLSTKSYPIKIQMLQNANLEGISFIPGYRHFIGNEKDYFKFKVQCFPVYSLLKAINVTTIDYFSLDIEGAELDVLKTIPWDSVFIKMFSVEVHEKYVEPVKEYMTSVGYKYLKFIKNGYSHDQIYIHKSVPNNDPIA